MTAVTKPYLSRIGLFGPGEYKQTGFVEVLALGGKSDVTIHGENALLAGPASFIWVRLWSAGLQVFLLYT